MIQYKWTIEKLITLSNQDGLENVVKCIAWKREAIKGDVTESMTGTEVLNEVNRDTFINYNNLTYDIICSWLSGIEEAVDNNLESKINHVTPEFVIQELPLPFKNN